MTFKQYDLVMVRDKDEGVYYTQRFVIEHNGLFFCERDDGILNELIGWKYCIPNQGHKLHEVLL